MDEYVDILHERALTESYSNMYNVWESRDYLIINWFSKFKGA